MLDAAIHLMAERGFEATTLAAVGERAGYSRGLAHHHFGSKADLFAGVIRSLSARLAPELERALDGSSGVASLLAFVEVHRRFCESEPEIARALFVLWCQSLIVESSLREAAVGDLLGHRALVRDIIAEGIRSGAIRSDADAEAEAVQFCGTLFGLTLQWLIDPAAARLGEIQRPFKARIVATLSPPGHVPAKAESSPGGDSGDRGRKS